MVRKAFSVAIGAQNGLKPDETATEMAPIPRVKCSWWKKCRPGVIIQVTDGYSYNETSATIGNAMKMSIAIKGQLHNKNNHQRENN
jgi:hypothetical protein